MTGATDVAIQKFHASFNVGATSAARLLFIAFCLGESRRSITPTSCQV